MAADVAVARPTDHAVGTGDDVSWVTGETGTGIGVRCPAEWVNLFASSIIIDEEPGGALCA